MSNNTDILDRLQFDLESFAVPGDYSADWTAIEQKLDRRKGLVLWQWTSFAVGVLLVSFMGYQMFSDKLGANHINETTVEQTETLTNPTIVENVPEHLPEVVEDRSKTETQNVIPVEPIEKVAADANKVVLTPATDESNQPIIQHDKIEDDIKSVMPLPVITEDEFVLSSKDADLMPATIEPVLSKVNKTVAFDPDLLPPPVKPFVEFGVSMSPGLATRKLAESTDFGGLLNRTYLEKVEGKVRASVGLQYSVDIAIPITERLYCYTGLGLSSISEVVSFDHLIDSNVVVDEANNIITGYIPRLPWQIERIQHKGVNKYDYLNIPIMLEYRVSLSDKFTVIPKAGVNFYLNTNTAGKEVDATKLELFNLQSSRISSSNMLLNTGVSLRYQNNKHWAFEASPFYSRMMKSMYAENSPIENKPYLYGLNVGVRYIMIK